MLGCNHFDTLDALDGGGVLVPQVFELSGRHETGREMVSESLPFSLTVKYCNVICHRKVARANFATLSAYYKENHNKRVLVSSPQQRIPKCSS